jgi:hypothetical protein
VITSPRTIAAVLTLLLIGCFRDTPLEPDEQTDGSEPAGVAFAATK